MTVDEKWDFLSRLDDELLMGGVILSEWTSFIVRDVDTAFCNGANLACILAAQAAIESHLRYEYGAPPIRNAGAYHLIEHSQMDASLKADLHRLRAFRNQWVHLNDPHDDHQLLLRPELVESELEEMARHAIVRAATAFRPERSRCLSLALKPPLSCSVPASL